ncbi:Hypothetical_protein [Hexamita inflata]|uniref:Hypothetical_protein n=1 Tax=Hexamita inflata TaxID=28002 RepID=A0AA86U2E3_9EUKA|nr:Hypothetical protein HINF_LOCUS25454 [Hexamita inflata]
MKENNNSIDSQEMIRYQTKINNFIIHDFKTKLDMFNNAEQNIIQLQELYSKFQRALAQIPNLQLQRYKKASPQKSREFISRNEYTKMFKYALQMCLQTDFCEASNQQICKTINSLSTQQRNIFWIGISQQIFTNFHYCKSNKDIRNYYNQQYIQNILKINDKEYIKQFVDQNQSLSISQTVQHLMTSYFKSKDVYLNGVIQYVRYEKRQNNTYTKEDIIPRYSIYKDQQQYKLNQQQYGGIKLDQQILQQYGQILKMALQSSLNIEIEYSTQIICQTINALNKQQSKIFWNYLKQTQKTAYMKLKMYYKTCFQSVLFSDHLTEDDKTIIRNQLDQDQTSSIAEITQSLLQNYFKDRDIFYYEIYRFVQHYTYQIQFKCINRRKNTSNNIYYTEIYRQGLSHVLEQDMDINIEPEEIIKQIDQLDRKQSKQLWKFLEANVIPHKTVQQLKCYYRSNYYQGYQNESSSITREQKQNNFTKFYNVALYKLFQHPLKDQSPKAICETINSLNQQQSLQFWNYLTTIVEPKQSIALLKQYYNNSFQAVLYSGHLTAEDKQSILQFCEQNAELTKKQQTKQLLETQYQDRDIFYWEMYRCISNYETLNKQKTQQNE